MTPNMLESLARKYRTRRANGVGSTSYGCGSAGISAKPPTAIVDLSETVFEKRL